MQMREKGKQKKLAVLFPGVGYTCQKPLLTLAASLAAERGYEVICLSYGGFPQNVKGDPEKMQQCFAMALEQTEMQLGTVELEEWDEVVLIGKSIGTVVACAWAETHIADARMILMTPIEETFQVGDKWLRTRNNRGDLLCFHGSADPWAETPRILELCCTYGIPSRLIPGGNHSLECGEPEKDRAMTQTVEEDLSFFLEQRPRRTIPVVAAVICEDYRSPHRFFATAKGYGKYKGQWEFPGGKVEAGETAEEALVREIREELNTCVRVGTFLKKIQYEYPEFTLVMDCFLAEVISGHLELKEASEARWLTKEELYDVNWLPADLELIEVLRNV